MSDDFDRLSSPGKVIDVLWHAALPLLAYMAGSFAVTTMLMKNSLMDNLAAEYVRTAIAKGMDFRRAVFNHALRNSLIPIATSFGSNISLILTGSFLIEKIFNIDGFGLLGFESLVERDYPVVMGILVISALLFLIGNILSDICVALVDPRGQVRQRRVGAMNPNEPRYRIPGKLTLNPLTVKQWQRFRSIKRGYYSAIILAAALVASLGSELLVNSRALLVYHQGAVTFPTYGDIVPGRVFGLDYDYETDYRDLRRLFAERDEGDWVLMPPVAYDALENDLRADDYPPYPPSWSSGHYLGTDSTGRDVLARLVYGFRIAFSFAFLLLACNYLLGIALGAAMGFWGRHLRSPVPARD